MSDQEEEWKQRFEAKLPRVQGYIQGYFRSFGYSGQKFEDAVEDALGIAWKSYRGELEKGKKPDEYISVIAKMAGKQVRDGRSVTEQDTAKDVLSPRAQRHKGFTVQSLPESDTGTADNEAIDAIADTRQATPADQAAFRIDTPRWMDRLGPKRPIVEDAMIGCTTKEMAEKFEKSQGRIAQIRREAAESYEDFHRLPKDRGR